MTGKPSRLALLCGLALAVSALPAMAGPNLCRDSKVQRSAAEAALRHERYVRAYGLFRTQAERGNAFAQMRLGNLYYLGHGVAQNYATAVRWWTAAAEQGNATARCNLGVMYLAGFGVKRDDVLALMWFTLAGGAGHHDAIAKRDVTMGWRLTYDENREGQDLAAHWPACKYRDAERRHEMRSCVVKPE